MPYQCGNCQSLFLKTLEVRVHVAGNALLYKKRCKRCKFKCLLQKTSLQGPLQPTTPDDWQRGRKVRETACVGHARMMVGEYTARISRAKEPPLDYLNRIAQVQRQDTLHETQKNAAHRRITTQTEEPPGRPFTTL
jgi:hypothetical protein